MSKVKRKELGKGLKALLGGFEDADETGKSEIVKELATGSSNIPIDQIVANPYQPRTEFDQEALEELAASIKTYGLIQPITVRRVGENHYQLISGERRLRASKLAQLTEVPAYIRLADDTVMLEMALVENIQRQDLNAMEVAISYQRLVDEYGLTHDDLSERVGKKRSTVSNYLRLLKLPPQIQQALKDQEITMGHARALAGVQHIDKQLALYQSTIANDLSVRGLEQLIKSHSTKKTTNRPTEKNTEEEKFAIEKLSAYFGQKVNVNIKDNGSGIFSVTFRNRRDLNDILEQLDLI